MVFEELMYSSFPEHEYQHFTLFLDVYAYRTKKVKCQALRECELVTLMDNSLLLEPAKLL